MPKKIEMIGKRFGRLTVIAKAEHTKNGQFAWICKCDCGNITQPILGYSLRSGDTTSCGCRVVENFKKHGKSTTRIYNVYHLMKKRCFNPNDPRFSCYGKRGITVCQEWQDSFQAFYDYVSQLPHFGEKGYSLDRINNDGNYEPNNVRWATAYEQQNNKRNNKKAVKS